VIRPFHGGGQHELSKQPKVYGFDTGMVSFARGWDPLRQDDFGLLWEHLVLEHLLAHFPDVQVRYWRDKAHRELDFVLAHGRDAVDVVECKWDPAAFDPSALAVFRRHYPRGRNYLVTPSGDPARTRRFADLEVRVCTPSDIQ
jgi:predicted AAA+ superfamily ATPase